MNRQTVLQKLAWLEHRIALPSRFNENVLKVATDDELDRLEREVRSAGGDALWEALVAVYASGERAS